MIRRYHEHEFQRQPPHDAGIKHKLSPPRYFEKLFTLLLRQRILLDRIDWNERCAYEFGRKVPAGRQKGTLLVERGR